MMKGLMFGLAKDPFYALKTVNLRKYRLFSENGGGSDISIINCERNSDINFNLINTQNDTYELEFTIFDNNILVCIECKKVFIPSFELENNSDYRNLGICIFSMAIEENNNIQNILSEMKIERNQTQFLIDNYNKGYIHDQDYLFMKHFAEIECPGCFLDIGANIGQTATSIANAHPTIRIKSYEPDALLSGNLELVKELLCGRMEYFQAGIGEIEETKRFYIPHIKDEYFSQEGSFLLQEIQSTSSINRILEQNVNYTEDDIEIAEFDFRTINLNQEDIECYFVKIDTQGYEKSAIMGIKNIIDKCHPIIILEKGFESEEILPLLTGYDINYYDVKINKFVQHETNSANVFLINNKLTNNEQINEMIQRIL